MGEAWLARRCRLEGPWQEQGGLWLAEVKWGVFASVGLRGAMEAWWHSMERCMAALCLF